MDILLSLRTTIRSDFRWPALLRPSNAIPPVRAPSPTTEITLKFSFFRSLAFAMPKAAEIAVELWPVPNESYSLSYIFGNPEIPLCCLNVWNLFDLPVNSL